jgi:hypothetical protein
LCGTTLFFTRILEFVHFDEVALDIASPFIISSAKSATTSAVSHANDQGFKSCKHREWGRGYIDASRPGVDVMI